VVYCLEKLFQDGKLWVDHGGSQMVSKSLSREIEFLVPLVIEYQGPEMRGVLNKQVFVEMVAEPLSLARRVREQKQYPALHTEVQGFEAGYGTFPELFTDLAPSVGYTGLSDICFEQTQLRSIVTKNWEYLAPNGAGNFFLIRDDELDFIVVDVRLRTQSGGSKWLFMYSYKHAERWGGKDGNRIFVPKHIISQRYLHAPIRPDVEQIDLF